MSLSSWRSWRLGGSIQFLTLFHATTGTIYKLVVSAKQPDYLSVEMRVPDAINDSLEAGCFPFFKSARPKSVCNFSSCGGLHVAVRCRYVTAPSTPSNAIQSRRYGFSSRT